MRSKMFLLTLVILAIVLFIWAVIVYTTHRHTYTYPLPYILFCASALMIMISWIGTLIRQALRKQWFWLFGMLVLVIGFAFLLFPDAVFFATVGSLIYLLIPDGPSPARSEESTGMRREPQRPRRRDGVEEPPLPFRIVLWSCLLCTGLLWCWLGAIGDSWFRYEQVVGNPFLAFAVLVEALGFTFLSMAWLHLTSRARRQQRYSRPLRISEERWFQNWGWAIFWGVFLSMNAFTGHSLIIPPDASMTSTNFVYRNIFIGTGMQVRFMNSKEGSMQILCVGTDGHCLSGGNAPDELRAPGLRLLPGQAQTIKFLLPGTYTVWSLSTPGMSVTIHVTEGCESCDGP